MIRACRERRGVAPAAVLAVAAVFALLVAPSSARAISHKQADRIALKTLKAKQAGAGVALFAAPRALRPGTTVGEDGGAGRAVELEDKAYLYWLDLYYGALFQHSSVLLLLDAKTGKKIKRQDMLWQPLVNGKPPKFLATADAYRSDRYQVYDDPVVGVEPARPSAKPASNGRAVPAGTFDKDCVVMIGPTTDPTFAGNFAAMGNWADNAHIKNTVAKSKADLHTKIDEQLDAGCQDVFLYIAGHGEAPPGWVDKKGKKHPGGPAAVYTTKPGDKAGAITPADLDEILKQHAVFEFKIKIDACFAGRFKDLKSNRNLRVLELSSGADQTSQGYLPNAPYKKKDGEEVTWKQVADNPYETTEFTNGDIHGLNAWIEDPAQQAEHPGLAGAIEASKTLGKDFDFAAGVIPPGEPGHTDPEVYTNPPLFEPPPPVISPVAPNAGFGWSPNSPPIAPKAGQSVAFDGTASSDPDGSIAGYHWDFAGPKFGDGSPSVTTADGPTPSAVFSQPGVYPVTLTVTDAAGHTGTITQDVYVSGAGGKGRVVSDIPCDIGSGTLLVYINVPTYGENADITSPAPVPYEVPGCPGLFIDSITVTYVLGPAPTTSETDAWGQPSNHLKAEVKFSGSSVAPGPGVVTFVATWN